jgi:rod shape-determining protein MreC
VVAFVFMLLNKTESVIMDRTTLFANEILSPVVEIFVMPATILSNGYGYLRSLSKIDKENKELREENRRLVIADAKNKALEIENKLLSRLLNYEVPPEAGFVTARVIAEEGDAFSHAVTVYIGNNQNVMKGQVVLGDKGVIGRVESVGRNYAKIFLINDINSKIPVMFEKNRVRGILSGENSPLPKMIFIPLDAEVSIGDIIVTSGVGGVFPAGLKVGKVVSVDRSRVKVKPFNDLNRLEHVLIVDYHLPIYERREQ